MRARRCFRTRGPAQSVVVDRPYLLVIRDTKTNAILFLGRVTDPTQTDAAQP